MLWSCEQNPVNPVIHDFNEMHISWHDAGQSTKHGRIHVDDQAEGFEPRTAKGAVWVETNKADHGGRLERFIQVKTNSGVLCGAQR